MTSVRPEHGGAYGEPYGGAPYGGDPYPSVGPEAHGEDLDPYRAAVDALVDPLSDPLPGQREPVAEQPVAEQPVSEAAPRSVFEPQLWPQQAEQPQQFQQPQQPQSASVPPQQMQAHPPQYAQPTQYGQYAPPTPYAPQQATHPPQQVPHAHQQAQRLHGDPYQPQADPYQLHGNPQQPQQPQRVHWDGAAYEDPRTPAPAPNPAPDPAPAPAQAYAPSAPASGAHEAYGSRQEPDRRTVGLRQPGAEELERRATAVGGVRAKERTERPPGPTRLEARRALRAARPGPGIIASRFIGEVFITFGVLMLLFVGYQLWWTNVLAGQQAGGATSDLQDEWDEEKSEGKDEVAPERKAGAFEPGEGFAVMHIPKIDITAPIAEGVSKDAVLDKGMIGHYGEKPLKTAMPWDKKGNFALAGHRNTHGEPFRYVNKLEAGDEVVVETQSTFYTYEVTRQLPSTSPSNTGVIDPVPDGSGFKGAGRYVTLTTCTPEFTSKYRLIVWGKMVDERPRGKGKPDALVD